MNSTTKINFSRMNTTTIINSKHVRDREQKIHEKFDENVKLLTHIYPPSKEFQSVFKRNMLAKITMSAFQHVIYYLFNVLNPEITKTKIKSYPVFDVKQESAFRSEVTSYVQWINTEYEDANIPVLMTSQLVCPKGIKFAKFMLKLSMLALLEHVKRDAVGFVRPHRDSRITHLNIKNLKKVTALHETEIETMQNDFEVSFNEAQQIAQEILEEHNQKQQELMTVNKTLEQKRQQTVSTSNDALEQKLEEVESKMAHLKELTLLCAQGLTSLNFLSSNDANLESVKSTLVIPKSVEHFFNESTMLDLCNLFKSLNFLLEEAAMELPFFTKEQLVEMKEQLEELNLRSQHLEQECDFRNKEIVEICGGAKKMEL